MKKEVLEHYELHPTQHPHHPIFHQKLTIGQKTVDKITSFGGSWTFIGIFAIVVISWICVNAWLLVEKPFDPYPFILLNLTLSTLAAIQAPVILMSQKREEERDRIDAKYDHAVNRKAEREIKVINNELREIKQLLLKSRR